MFGRQRFKTDLVDINVEPTFNDTFLIMLQDPYDNTTIDVNNMIRMKIPLELHLFEHKNNEKTLLSVKKVEWRYLLTSNNKGRIFLSEEMFGFGARHNIALGVINFEISIVNALPSQSWIKDSILKEQLVVELKYDKDLIKELFVKSEKFNNEYKSLKSGNEDRILKLWAESIYDREYRPIFEFVSPLNPSDITRYLETPLHCLRFVSLIPYRRPINDSIKYDFLLDTKVFLSTGYGSSAEHAILLCSLLLSFRLNAYVALGHNNNNTYYCVIVIDFNSEENNVVLWDACYGEKISVKDPRIYKYLRSVSCLFNDRMFYALNQNDDDILKVDFDLKDPTLWS